MKPISVRSRFLVLIFLFILGKVYADDGIIELRMSTGSDGHGIPLKEASDTRSRANRAVFEYFHKTHPHIRIVPSGGIELAGEAAEAGFLMSMAGDTAPDIIYVNFRELNDYLNQHFLYPLDEFLARPEGKACWKRVNPIIQREITVKGHVYSLPWMQYVMALYYRRDLFKAAGLDPDKPPQTWDEFYHDAQLMTDLSKRQSGIAFSGPTSQSWYWCNFLWQAGGDVFQKGADGKTHAVFASPQGVTAIRFWNKLLTEKWTVNGLLNGPAAYCGKDATTMINEGRAGMWFSYSSDSAVSLRDLDVNNLGIAALPAGPSGRANEINAGMWGINNAIKDRQKREACWEFIKFSCSDEAARVRTQAFVNAGLGKLVEPTLLEKFGYTEYIDQVDPQWVKANRDAFKSGHPEPHAENSQQIYTELDRPLQKFQLSPNSDPYPDLEKAQSTVETNLLGYRPRAEIVRDRNWAKVILILGSIFTVGLLAFRIRKQRLAPIIDELPASKPAGQSGKTKLWVFLMILPALGAILLWAYYPLARGLVIAFQDYKILSGTHWVGLDNFIDVFRQPRFWVSIRNSIFYVSLTLGIGFFVPIFLAIMLAEVPIGKMFFRTIYYLPAVTSALVTIYLWQWFYDKSPAGLFNTFLTYLHLTPQTWLDDPKLALICVVIPAIWAGAGPGSIIYLAALKTISDDLYEAADLDGATIWSKIRHIILPGLKPLIIINFIGAFIGSFKAMENIFVMTGGGPVDATHTLGLEIWKNAFMYLKFGYATAAAWIMGAMLVGFTMIQLRSLLKMQWGAAKV